MRFRKSAAAVVSVAVLVSGLSAAAYSPALADGGDSDSTTAQPLSNDSSPTVEGTACQPGEGVTTVVDLSGDPDPANNRILVGCAKMDDLEITSKTMADAFELTGITSDSDSFVKEIDGVRADYKLDGRWFSLWTSTQGGVPSGAPADDWQFASVGVGNGPVSVDQVYAWAIAPSDAMGGVKPQLTLDQVRQVGLSDEQVTPGDSGTTGTDPSASGTGGDSSTSTASTWNSRIPTVYGPTDDLAARNAVSWIDANTVLGDLQPTATNPEDMIFALAAVGIDRSLIDQLAHLLYEKGATMDNVVNLGTTDNPFYGKVARLVFALQVANNPEYDPTHFPAAEDGQYRDLVAELRAAATQAGDDAPYLSTVDLAYAILALARTSDGVPSNLVDQLKGLECTDSSSPNYGSWGMGNACDGYLTDTTSVAVQALLAAGLPSDDESVAATKTFLEGIQNDDGSFGNSDSDSEARMDFSGEAAQALNAVGSVDAAARAVQFIATTQVTCATLTNADVTSKNPLLTADARGLMIREPEYFDQGIAMDGYPNQGIRFTSLGLLAFGASLGNTTALGASEAAPEMVACDATDPGQATSGVPEPPELTQVSADGAAALGAKLAEQGNLLVGPDGTTKDYGLTEDAVFALAGLGVGGDQISNTLATIADSAETYIGQPADSALNWASIAKTALTAEIAGENPRDFGTDHRDLITELATALGTDGAWPQAAAFTESLAVLALDRAGISVDRPLNWLKSQQCSDSTNANYGTYGYGAPCSGFDQDATALTIQALTAGGVPATDNSVALAVQALVGVQSDAGGWQASFTGAGDNTNTTGLVVQALRGTSEVARDSSLADAIQAGENYVSSLAITADLVRANPGIPTSLIGMIAYNQAGIEQAKTGSLNAADLDQFNRATSQALLAFGAAPFGTMSASNAAAALPALEIPSDLPLNGGSPDQGGAPTGTPAGTTAVGQSGVATIGATDAGTADDSANGALPHTGLFLSSDTPVAVIVLFAGFLVLFTAGIGSVLWQRRRCSDEAA